MNLHHLKDLKQHNIQSANLHHLYMKKQTQTSMMQTKQNTLNTFLTLEEQLKVGMCKPFKRLSSLRFSRCTPTRTVLKQTLHTFYLRKKSVRQSFKMTLLVFVSHNKDIVGTSAVHLSVPAHLFVWNKYRMAKQILKSYTRKANYVNTFKFWLKFQRNNIQ